MRKILYVYIILGMVFNICFFPVHCSADDDDNMIFSYKSVIQMR